MRQYLHMAKPARPPDESQAGRFIESYSLQGLREALSPAGAAIDAWRREGGLAGLLAKGLEASRRLRAAR